MMWIEKVLPNDREFESGSRLPGQACVSSGIRRHFLIRQLSDMPHINIQRHLSRKSERGADEELVTRGIALLTPLRRVCAPRGRIEIQPEERISRIQAP